MMRAIHRLPCAMLLSVTVSAAFAQVNYPAQPVRLVVTTAPGGGLDTFARALAREFSDRAGQQFVVDNRPGAGTTIGTALVAKAKPDGYTLMLGNVSTLAIAKALTPRLAYDPLKDFAPITLITTSENVIVVHPSVPASSVKELIAYAKANPRKLNFGSAGNGTTTHLGGAMFAWATGIEMTHIPYKGSVAMLVDLLAGQMQLAFSSVPTALPHIKSGRLRALAVTRTQRSTILPELPTVQEAAGLKNFEVSLWQGIVAPAAVRPAIVSKLNQQIVASLRTPELKQQLTAQGLEPVGNTPEQFAAYIRAELAKWTQVVKVTGARIE